VTDRDLSDVLLPDTNKTRARLPYQSRHGGPSEAFTLSIFSCLFLVECRTDGEVKTVDDQFGLCGFASAAVHLCASS
jgi:hypothetical protein